MLALLQRVREARVEVDAQVVGHIGAGLLVLVCAEPADGTAQVERLVDRILTLRIFADEAGRMNRSVQDAGGGVLVVSQFTLAADTSRGTRPGFSGAATADVAKLLYEAVVDRLRHRHQPVETGRFGADMQVHLVNDGPVTIPLRIG